MKLEISKEQCLRLAELEGDAEIGAGLMAMDPNPCPYCEKEAEPGWIETENNGPIVPCPVCNTHGSLPRR